MKKSTRKFRESSYNLKIVGVFLLLVCVLIGMSLALRSAKILSESKFDPSHRFTVFVCCDKHLDTTSSHVISISPDPSSVFVLSIKGGQDAFTVGRYLKIPIDAFIEFPNKATYPKDKQHVLDEARLAAFSFQTIKTNLSFFDFLRVWVAAFGVSSHAFAVKEIDTGLGDQMVDKISSSFFPDSAVSEENISIDVLNGALVVGLGNRLARLISNIGAVVGSVSTADTPISKTRILYFRKEGSYTLRKLEQVLGVRAVTLSSRSSISDIIIELGQDRKSPGTF